MTTQPPSVKDSKLAFTALFVRRPILAAVLNTLLVVAGLAALVGVEVRELPDVDRPSISVRTTYEGAAPETIDQEVTQTIEGGRCARQRRQNHLLQFAIRHQPRNDGIRRQCRYGRCRKRCARCHWPRNQPVA